MRRGAPTLWPSDGSLGHHPTTDACQHVPAALVDSGKSWFMRHRQLTLTEAAILAVAAADACPSRRIRRTLPDRGCRGSSLESVMASVSHAQSRSCTPLGHTTRRYWAGVERKVTE
jgi:hypothetical protein